MPEDAYHLRARLPRSLAPRGLERALCRFLVEELEETFPGSEVKAELAEAGPAAVTLADGGIPPRAVRQAFAEALDLWQRVAPTGGPEWDTTAVAEIIDQLPRPRRRRKPGSNGEPFGGP